MYTDSESSNRVTEKFKSFVIKMPSLLVESNAFNSKLKKSSPIHESCNLQ